MDVGGVVDRVQRRLLGLRTVRWVVRWGVLQMVLVGMSALGLSAFALAGSPPVAALVLGCAAALLLGWGAPLRAFWDQRRWAWWTLLVVELTGLVAAALAPAPWALVVGSVGTGLLLHPDSREWVRPDRV